MPPFIDFYYYKVIISYKTIVFNNCFIDFVKKRNH